MKKIIFKTGIISALVLLFISATPTGISASKPDSQKDYYIHPVNTKIDSTSVAVKDLLELTKKL